MALVVDSEWSSDSAVMFSCSVLGSFVFATLQWHLGHPHRGDPHGPDWPQGVSSPPSCLEFDPWALHVRRREPILAGWLLASLCMLWDVCVRMRSLCTQTIRKRRCAHFWAKSFRDDQESNWAVSTSWAAAGTWHCGPGEKTETSTSSSSLWSLPPPSPDLHGGWALCFILCVCVGGGSDPCTYISFGGLGGQYPPS